MSLFILRYWLAIDSATICNTICKLDPVIDEYIVTPRDVMFRTSNHESVTLT